MRARPFEFYDYPGPSAPSCMYSYFHIAVYYWFFPMNKAVSDFSLPEGKIIIFKINKIRDANSSAQCLMHIRHSANVTVMISGLDCRPRLRVLICAP